jgi:hypothetical protein
MISISRSEPTLSAGSPDRDELHQVRVLPQDQSPAGLRRLLS